MVSMDDVANFISQQYASSAADRIGSTGYRNGCNETMALRETVDMGRGPYDPYWDWNQARPSYVVRVPQNFTAASPAPTDPVPNNRRAKIGDGWVRWLGTTVNQFYSANEFAQWVNGQLGIPGSVNQTVSSIFIAGTGLWTTDGVVASDVNTLDRDLTSAVSQTTPGYFSTDTQLRALLMYNCLCQNGSYASFTTDCSIGSQLSPPPGITAVTICSAPTQVVSAMLGSSQAQALEFLNEDSQSASNIGLEMVGQIETFEQGCISATCSQQPLF